MTSTYPNGTQGSVASFLAAIICRYRMSYCKPFIYVYDVSYLDFNCNCSYCLLTQFVLTVLCYSKLDVIKIAHEKSIFPNKQATNNNCAYCRYIYIYLYWVFFPRKSLYSLWLYTKSYSALSLTTNLSLYYVVITCTFCLFKSRSHHHGLIYKYQYGNNQWQDMPKTIVHIKMWGRSMQNPWLKQTVIGSYCFLSYCFFSLFFNYLFLSFFSIIFIM